MFNRTNKKKQNPQEKAAEVAREKEEKRRGNIISEQLYPELVKVSENVEDAKIVLQVLSSVIEGQFMNRKTTTKVSELGLEPEFDKDKTSERYKALFNIIKDEPITIAVNLVNSLGGIIVNNEKKLMKDKKLADLPIQFITYDKEKK